MNLRTQILFSVLGITLLAQGVFGFLAYRQISESRGDQLTIFLQYLNREVAERLTLPGNLYVSEIYLEELRKKFSTPQSILIIQKNNKILYTAGNHGIEIPVISQSLNEAYSNNNSHGLINLKGIDYYWATSPLSNKDYQLVMLEPTANEEVKIASTLRLRLISSGIIILWLAIWVSLLLSSKISRKLDEKNDQLKHMTLHDTLTHLPNRIFLTDRLEQLISQSQRTKHVFTLFLIDLDRFKVINDTLGHQFGDELLKMVSLRLQESLRDEDTVARLGGDEFAILLPRTDRETANQCADRIIQAMEKSFVINDVSIESKVSIGSAIYSKHGDNATELMKHADIAMYHAKKSQTGYAVYKKNLDTNSERRLLLMNDLREAIEQNEICVYYQPIVDQAKNHVVSAEALARWHHPKLGHISPQEFVPMAEQMGLILLLTSQIIKQALNDCMKWNKKGYIVGVNINISTYCLQNLLLPDEIYPVIQKNNLDADKVVLEITETALMHDLSRAGKVLNKLSDLGLKIAIDDFGIGYSSLSHLKDLPIDILKIDRSLIMDMTNNIRDAAIVKTISELGRNLNCQVVAEGVEDQKTIDSLKLLDIGIMQGFFYCEALPVDELDNWLLQYSEQIKIHNHIQLPL